MSGVCKKTGIWHISIAKKRHKTDYMLAAEIGLSFDVPRRAADLGCGLGHYCRIFSAYGWEVIDGFEGTEGIGKYKVYPWIYRVDLTRPLQFSPYDFVLCLEVGEHIPKKHEQVFIDNVCRASRQHIVLSWAIPGQYSASGHVNNRENDYVINELAKRGFILDNDMTKKLRKACYFNWFKETIMVFYG
jgi:2-polyprenyl-3-methyl-5-hydroxy-6-metoxy-1,4-benzoquinol methylase